MPVPDYDLEYEDLNSLPISLFDDISIEFREKHPYFNPSHEVGRRSLLSDRHDVIMQGSELLKSSMKDLDKVVWRDPILERMIVEKTSPDGTIREGSLIWNLNLFVSPYNNTRFSWENIYKGRRMRVAIPMEIKEGILNKPEYFVSSSGTKHIFSKYGILEAIRYHDKNLVTKRSKQVTISWEPEKDYRAL